MAFTLNGSNLLDRQTGEPDNVTVLPGRTVSFGIRTTF
jgi:iron complex outermembrane receptor protein